MGDRRGEKGRSCGNTRRHNWYSKVEGFLKQSRPRTKKEGGEGLKRLAAIAVRTVSSRIQSKGGEKI